MSSPYRPAWDKKREHRTLTGRPWRRLRAQVMARDSYLCQPCLKEGRYTEATEVDHIIALAKGGDDKPESLQSICTPCHEAKSRREAAEAAGHRVKDEIGTDGWPTGR